MVKSEHNIRSVTKNSKKHKDTMVFQTPKQLPQKAQNWVKCTIAVKNNFYHHCDCLRQGVDQKLAPHELRPKQQNNPVLNSNSTHQPLGVTGCCAAVPEAPQGPGVLSDATAPVCSD